MFVRLLSVSLRWLGVDSWFRGVTQLSFRCIQVLEACPSLSLANKPVAVVEYFTSANHQLTLPGSNCVPHEVGQLWAVGAACHDISIATSKLHIRSLFKRDRHTLCTFFPSLPSSGNCQAY